MKKQTLNYYIVPEINNKFLSRLVKVIAKENTFVSQFKFYDVKLIKNIISQELIGSRRPKISAVILKKNITVTLRSTIELGSLVFLQKKPIIWSDKLYATSNVSDNFFKGVFIVKNNKLELVFSNTMASRMDIMIKSAYFD